MTRLNGKVISRPLTRVPKEGAQVLWNNKIYKFVDFKEGSYLFFEIGHDGMHQMSTSHPHFTCSELCIKYKTYWPQENGSKEFKTVPLKYSQWQAAIDNGEVDSDKEVDFYISLTHNEIAKIIPAKKEKLYTQTELEMKCKMAHHYGTIGRKFEDFIVLHLK